MNTSSFNLTLPRGCLLACLALAIASGGLRAADPRIMRIEDGDTINVTAGSGVVVFELGLSLAPAADPEAVLEIMQDTYVAGSVPLKRAGNAWKAEVPAAHLADLLTTDRLVARFPSTGDRPLHLNIPRDRFLSRLESAQSLVRDDPLFFEAPEAPKRPDVPSTDVIRAEAEAFLAAAWVFDQEWAAYVYRFSSRRSDAHALFQDLITSGRLPWEGAAVTRLKAAYDKLRAQQDELERARETWREQVRAFAQKWNAAHGGDEPLSVSFGQAA
jgi:hypothetical protein